MRPDTIVPSSAGVATLLLAATAVVGCAAPLRHALSRRPTVLVAAEPGERRPDALTDIHNTGRCRVQVEARGQAGDVVGASEWIAPDGRSPRFELPAGFRWIVLEVDPGCDAPSGSIRYATTAPEPELADAGVAPPSR